MTGFNREIAELPKIHMARVAYDPTKGDHVPFSYTFWKDGAVTDQVHGVISRSKSGVLYVRIGDNIVIRSVNGTGPVLYDNAGILYRAAAPSLAAAIRKGVVFMHRLHMSTPRNRAYYQHQH